MDGKCGVQVDSVVPRELVSEVGGSDILTSGSKCVLDAIGYPGERQALKDGTESTAFKSNSNPRTQCRRGVHLLVYAPQIGIWKAQDSACCLFWYMTGRYSYRIPSPEKLSPGRPSEPD
jgi:hypothetical protein